MFCLHFQSQQQQPQPQPQQQTPQQQQPSQAQQSPSVTASTSSETASNASVTSSNNNMFPNYGTSASWMRQSSKMDMMGMTGAMTGWAAGMGMASMPPEYNRYAT